MREPELSRLFDRGPAASDAALQEVIARRDRHRLQRLRRIGVSAAVIVVAGAATSVTVVREQGRSTANSPKIAAAPAGAGLTWRAASSAASIPARSAGVNGSRAFACPMDAPCPPTSVEMPALFHRVVAGVAVTARLSGFSDFTPQASVPRASGQSPGGTSTSGQSASGQSASGLTTPARRAPDLPAFENCAAGSSLEVLTTIGATSHDLIVAAPRTEGATIGVVSTALYTEANRDVAIVVVHTAAASATVAAHFSDGSSDAMRAVDGWAVLVDSGQPQTTTAGFGSVTVSTTSGSATTRAVLERLPGLAFPRICLPRLPVTPTGSPGVTAG